MSYKFLQINEFSPTFTNDQEALEYFIKTEANTNDLTYHQNKDITTYHFDFGGMIMIDEPEFEFDHDGITYSCVARHASYLVDKLSVPAEKYPGYFCFSNWMHMVFITETLGKELREKMNSMMMSNLNMILDTTNEINDRAKAAGIYRPIKEKE